MLLDGKTAFVTGASRGIGKAIALKLAENGADVIIHYNSNRDAAETTAAEIENLGRKAYIISFNLSDQESIEKSVKELLKDVTPDILVNNAGLTADNLAMRMKSDDWNRVIDVNLSGTFFCDKNTFKTTS